MSEQKHGDHDDPFFVIEPGQTINGIKNDNKYPVFVHWWKPLLTVKDAAPKTEQHDAAR